MRLVWYLFDMRLRGLVFERFVTFERAEVSLCDDSGAPLDVVLFVGDSASGKSALLRGVSSLLAEAVGAGEDLDVEDVRRGANDARCRAVFDDVVDGTRAIITLEKEIRVASSAPASFRGTPANAFDRWRTAIDNEAAPKVAFSVASSDGEEDSDDEPDGSAPSIDPLFEWFASLRGGWQWDAAVRALDRVLWPARFDHVTPDGDIVFATPSGTASVDELGDAVVSVVVMTLELLRLSTARPTEELVYVIDDIDAHLHPRWQSRIIGDLRRTFPRVQLIATTHSPWVVASVEPYQVFHLERLGGATNVVRISDRIPRDERISNVMDVAFGAPDLAGPRWLHALSLNVRREVMRSIEEGLARGAVVYGLPDAIHIKDVRDAFGENVLASPDGVMGYVFFIDLEPGSPWGHACEYLFRTHDGKLSRKAAVWPPAGLDRFVPFARG
jgi:hypothetical protein